ncbi:MULTISPECIES: hypothetical protein [unclassified Shewanella]|uniref:hypothetical protein n=1 Tax=unclassified Shewanella TaxID=196818 RepID=UPI0021D9DE29|nr:MULTISPECIES: hypothetical protein [unclassified Shewanella]MCU8002675.1 hypothetical protein [Shewanella sp. SM96]MCU8060970.1 hypothetical protein [Shewanella sp. SM55]
MPLHLSLVALEDSIGGSLDYFILRMSITFQGNISVIAMGVGYIGMWYLSEQLDWLKKDVNNEPSGQEIGYRQKKLYLQTWIGGAAYLFTYGITLILSVLSYHDGNVFKIATSGAGVTGLLLCFLTGIAIWQLRLRLEWMAEEQEQLPAKQSDNNSLSN